MKYIFLIITSLILFGCSSSVTTIKEKDVAVKIPDIQAEAPAEIKAAPDVKEKIIEFFKGGIPEDIYYESNAVVTDTATGRVTKVKTKFYPAAKDSAGNITPRAETYIKQDPVKVKVNEGVKVVKESTWDKLIILAVLIIIIAAVIWLIKRRKS